MRRLVMHKGKELGRVVEREIKGKSGDVNLGG